ncbi:hypothetical protein HYC85_002230 [Camellia sinensis]|uniref:Pentacotripeptide-repeat region of PRORP domain-containing protein n=1 Tax=Camellia sinensis TaxID=4442 RepID=A0A7J7I8X1_CAMSI|nr:hypothetical protein HYC85_002230 [Camellia sinensis]
METGEGNMEFWNKTHILCMRCGRHSFHFQKSRCSACVFPAAHHRSVNAIQRKMTGTSQMSYLRNVPRRFRRSFREGDTSHPLLVQSFTIVTNSLSHSHMATSSHLPPTTDPLIRIRDPSLLWRWVVKKVCENRNGLDKESIILEGCSWGPSLENALHVFDEMPQTELVIGVLKRLKDFDLAMSYFRFVETKTNKAHCPEAYNSLLMVMGRSKKFDCLDQILEEMSLSGFGPSNSTCFDLVVSCAKSHKLREAFGFIESMRKFKFCPAFLAYTIMIGALFAVPELDLMLTLFHQMQELGYEVNVQLFTTLIRVFAKEGRVDAALSLLDKMKSNYFDANIVVYNVCIDGFGKAGKVDMAWKFFHEMKANGLMLDDVTYTSMIGVLWKANRLNEAVELFEQMELNRKVPCAYAYNTMIMAYGSAGKFDEAYNLLKRQKLKGSIPSVIAYNSILTCLAKNGKVDEALRIFEEIKNDATPNLSTYNILIGMLCKAGKVEEALVIQEAMKGAGLFPNVLTMNIMIDRLCKPSLISAIPRILATNLFGRGM